MFNGGFFGNYPSLSGNAQQKSGGLLGRSDAQSSDNMGGLLQFLQSPEALSMAAGLLSAAQPSMTAPQSIAGGMSAGIKAAQETRQKERAYGMDAKKLELDEKKILNDIAMEKARLGLSQQSHGLALENHQQGIAAKQAQAAAWQAAMQAGAAPAAPAAVPVQEPSMQHSNANGILSGGIGQEIALGGSEGDYLNNQPRPQAAQQPSSTVNIGGREVPRATYERAMQYGNLTGDIPGAFKIMTEESDTEKPTGAFLTQNQNIVQAAQNMVPVIDKLIASEVPGQLTRGIFGGDAQAAYEADTITLAEGLLAARNLPQTDATLNKMLKVAQRHGNESEAAYKTRLNGLREEILTRASNAGQITSVNSGAISQQAPQQAPQPKARAAKDYTDDELRAIINGRQ